MGVFSRDYGIYNMNICKYGRANTASRLTLPLAPISAAVQVNHTQLLGIFSITYPPKHLRNSRVAHHHNLELQLKVVLHIVAMGCTPKHVHIF